MSSDDDDPFAEDRTVLRPSVKRPQPGGASRPAREPPPAAPEPEADDHTVMRPRPGRGRAQAPPAPARPASAPAAAPRRAPARGAPPAVEVRGSGLNPLVSAATALLSLLAQLRGSVRQLDVRALRTYVVGEMRAFEGAALSAGVSNETAVAARYTLCTVLDEAVLSTPWGSESPWASQTLLSAFHKETWGGEKVFALLDRLMRAPAQNLDYLEMLYICLALGFEGKFRVVEGGRAQLERIQDNLYRTIRAQRSDFERELSPHWKGLTDQRNRLVRYVPLWVVGALAGVLLLALYAGFTFTLSGAASPVFGELQKIGRGPPPVLTVKEPAPATPPPPPPAPKVDLRKLLAPQIRAGLVQVEESSGRSTVVLKGDGLFSSGSVSVKSTFLPVLDRIAWALNQVPGRVLVAGYTDNVPIHTLRFPSNWSLSQARADAVKNVLVAKLKKPARVRAEGMGDTLPVATNATAAGRAKNRRVEISVFDRGGGL